MLPITGVETAQALTSIPTLSSIAVLPFAFIRGMWRKRDGHATRRPLPQPVPFTWL